VPRFAIVPLGLTTEGSTKFKLKGWKFFLKKIQWRMCCTASGEHPHPKRWETFLQNEERKWRRGGGAAQRRAAPRVAAPTIPASQKSGRIDPAHRSLSDVILLQLNALGRRGVTAIKLEFTRNADDYSRIIQKTGYCWHSNSSEAQHLVSVSHAELVAEVQISFRFAGRVKAEWDVKGATPYKM